MNVCCLVGRITSDDKVKHAEYNNRYVLNFDIAVNFGYGDSEQTAYFSCSQWSAKPLGVAQYLTKGKQVAVTGEVSLESREHAGKTYANLKLAVRNLSLLGDRDKAPVGTNFLEA